MDKNTCRIKRLSLSDGCIGKPAPFTPTFLGVFVLNQYFLHLSKPQIVQTKPVLINKDRSDV